MSKVKVGLLLPVLQGSYWSSALSLVGPGVKIRKVLIAANRHRIEQCRAEMVTVVVPLAIL